MAANSLRLDRQLEMFCWTIRSSMWYTPMSSSISRNLGERLPRQRADHNAMIDLPFYFLRRVDPAVSKRDEDLFDGLGSYAYTVVCAFLLLHVGVRVRTDHGLH